MEYFGELSELQKKSNGNNFNESSGLAYGMITTVYKIAIFVNSVTLPNTTTEDSVSMFLALQETDKTPLRTEVILSVKLFT